MIKSNTVDKKSNSQQSAVPAALLRAAKNQLPPVQFHHVHGANVRLSNNKFVARRVDSFCQGLVFSNRIILPNERVYIKLIKVAERQNGKPQWSGTIRFGFTSVDPATLRYKMPKYACPDMTSAGTTWAKALSDKVVHENIVIHFSYDTSGRIHYGINNQDCGIFHANVATTKHLWFILDIYGNTTGVELIDPRIHSNSGLNGLDGMKMDDFQAAESTLSPAAGRRRSSQNNSLNQRTALTMAEITPYAAAPEHLMTLAALNRPIANQNIYSPSPMHANVISTHPQNNYHQPRVVGDGTTSTVSLHHRYMQPAANNIVALNDAAPLPMSRSSNQQYQRQAAIRGRRDREQELDQAFGRLSLHRAEQQQMNATKSKQTSSPSISVQRNHISSSKQQSSSSSSKTANAKSRTSKRLDKNASTSSAKRQHGRQQANSANSSVSSSSSSLHIKGTESSKKSSKSTSEAQATRDCPICYERPINCVLYQCGHMCTCYECGVKQWRTQSRTCPICRTVIKDVIKTFMS